MENNSIEIELLISCVREYEYLWMISTSAESTALVAAPDILVAKKRRLEKSLTDALQLWTTRQQVDNDELFGRSVAAQLRCLSTPAKSLAKLNIQKVRKMRQLCLWLTYTGIYLYLFQALYDVSSMIWKWYKSATGYA